jgi:hypothetical protein
MTTKTSDDDEDGVDMDAPHDRHGAAASTTALTLLKELRRHPEGCGKGELAVLCCLRMGAVQSGLDGLQQRGRVQCGGRGKHAKWFTTEHFKART